MPPPILKTVTRTQGNNAAIKDGSVNPAGFTFALEEVPVLVHAFRPPAIPTVLRSISAGSNSALGLVEIGL